jgi:hypothetical protein
VDYGSFRGSFEERKWRVTRLACLPLDDRPVNYDYPRFMAEMAGIAIDLPPREWLGNPWRPSHHTDLVAWLERAAARADALLVAVDTLGYGGLTPSRTSTDSTEQVLSRLSILKQLKAARPELQILAYSVVLRVSRDDSAEEEKDYWATYGSRMFRLSYLEHKSDLGEADAAEMAERDTLKIQVPDSVYVNYLQGRKRNHAVNLAMLDWLEKGVFDYLILPQDDTADYGWNIAEARALQSLIRLRGLSDRAITYPGADETGDLLLARFVCRQAGFSPRVWPRYSSLASAQVVTSYEDRPIHELLKAHLAPLDGVVADSPQEADLLLFVNAPAERQGAADLQWLIAQELTNPAFQSPIPKNDLYRSTRREMTSPARSVEEFSRALQAASRVRNVALVDVAFVNGADLFLGKRLMEMEDSPAPCLSAYSGWNTAGNTLGSALAHAVLHLLMLRSAPTSEQRAAHLAFLFRRYLDDYFYQAVERTRLACEDLPNLGLAPTMERLPADKLEAVEGRLQARLEPAIKILRDQFARAGLVQDVCISNIHLPWQRLFEIDFDVQVELP